MTPSVLHLFSGSGGLAKGFTDAGFTGVGLDLDPRACDDFRRLTGEAAIVADIGAMSPADLRALVPTCPDVVATSSPCVGFSGCLPSVTSKTAKYQGFNALALHGVALVLEAWRGAARGRTKPALLVFENVPGIKSRGAELLRHLEALLHAEGYAVDMRVHDCGEVGEGLAQRRRRFLLVARHMPSVADFLRQPPRHTPVAIRDVLWQLPSPRPGGPDHMHRLSMLSAKNWLRLACIPAGGDHRDLPAEVLLYPCGSDELEAATGIRWGHCAGRHAGKLGVLDWERPAKTVIGKARVCNTWNAVADPRVHAGRPDCYGVADDRKPSGAVRGTALVQSCKASVADPRLHCGQRADAYGVQAATDPSRTIVGHQSHDNVAGSIADPRVNVELQHHAHRGTMGVMAADGPAATVRGHHTIRQAPGAVDDPRVEARYNAKGWPAATHYLVDLDGRSVLYGPHVDFADPRPRGDLVIVARDGTLHRPFTDAELALLQGFPVDFVFCGPSSCARKSGATGRRKRIGNAVPPPTAYAIAVECRATLEASAAGGFRLAQGDVWVAPAQGATA